MNPFDNFLGNERTALNNALKKRDNFGYNFANSMGGISSQGLSGTGAGLANFASAFGRAFNGRTDAEIARTDNEYQNALKGAQIQEDAKNRAAMMDFKRFEMAQKTAEKDTKAMQEVEDKNKARNSAISALRELQQLADGGAINNMNKSTDNWFLSDESSQNIGKRTAALSSLLPLTNSQAKASGGSGINTVGEMMAYLGIPENATSAQIQGALPGLMNRLGVSAADVGIMPQAAPGNNIDANLAKLGIKVIQ